MRKWEIVIRDVIISHFLMRFFKWFQMKSRQILTLWEGLILSQAISTLQLGQIRKTHLSLDWCVAALVEESYTKCFATALSVFVICVYWIIQSLDHQLSYLIFHNTFPLSPYLSLHNFISGVTYYYLRHSMAKIEDIFSLFSLIYTQSFTIF